MRVPEYLWSDRTFSSLAASWLWAQRPHTRNGFTKNQAIRYAGTSSCVRYP
jgi:hypothetical protein